jgi:Tfp pilus assembly protein PilO
MTTSYINLGKFISLLERIPQIVRVDRIAITALDDGKVSAMVMITCYLSLQ